MPSQPKQESGESPNSWAESSIVQGHKDQRQLGQGKAFEGIRRRIDKMVKLRFVSNAIELNKWLASLFAEAVCYHCYHLSIEGG